MTSRLADTVGRFGVWRAAPLVTPELAAELERLGYGALWLGSSPAADLAIVDRLLAATAELRATDADLREADDKMMAQP